MTWKAWMKVNGVRTKIIFIKDVSFMDPQQNIILRLHNFYFIYDKNV